MRPTVIPSLVLASASPRRKELLERIGLALEVLPAEQLDETRRPNEEPIGYARRLAAEKARVVAARLSGDRPVLGADTIVIVDDGGDPVLGKPAGPEEARVMLTRLSGRSHLVATAYHLRFRGAERGRAVETEVTFRPLLPVEIEGYVGAREWEGKAGGYAIQGLAGAFVRRIHGSYTNVVGLPLCEVVEDLDALGALPPDWTLGGSVSFAERLARVRAQISAACDRAGRAPDSVELVAISKLKSADACREAVAAGQLLFGENYAQELRDKAREVKGARWHFVGPLQRNKVKYVVGVAELIHSVDSLPLLDAIAERAEKIEVVQRCLVQVNLAGEAQKSGCAPSELPALVAAFAARPSVRCEGLMCIPPAEGDPAPSFAALAALGRASGLHALSMGMSGDFEAAIACGATLVRIGTALFGARTKL